LLPHSKAAFLIFLISFERLANPIQTNLKVMKVALSLKASEKAGELDEEGIM